MSTNNTRYVVEASQHVCFHYDVVDQKEKITMCSCHLKRNAKLIVEVLNRAWGDIENDYRAGEMGG